MTWVHIFVFINFIIQVLADTSGVQKGMPKPLWEYHPKTPGLEEIYSTGRCRDDLNN